MRTALLSFTTALLLLAGSAAETSAAEPLAWTIKGKTYRGRFVGRENDTVTLELEKWGGKSIPRSWLSPESRTQADQEELRHADQPIAGLRAMEFVRIRRGRFTMGSPLKEAGRLAATESDRKEMAPGDTALDVEPEHEVVISRDFWLKRTEVTWDEWKSVADAARDNKFFDLGVGRCGAGDGRPGNHPVTGITWWDAVKWCNLKSQIEGLTPAYYFTPGFAPGDIVQMGNPVVYVRWDASGYRLPTEAEWEYACREGRNVRSPAFHSGGITKPGFEPSDPSLSKVAWYGGNSGLATHPVATREPNSFGLHDMHGNVAEWCWDWEGLLSSADAEDPRGAPSGQYRMFRGGSWADPARCCRAAYRGNLSPIAPSSELVGFRPVCGVDPQASAKPAAP